NTSSTKISFTAIQADSSNFQAEFEIKKNGKITGNLKATQIEPDSLLISYFDETKLRFDLDLELFQDSLSYNGTLFDLEIDKAGFPLTAEQLVFSGNSETLSLVFPEITVNQAAFTGTLQINDLDQEKFLKGRLESQKIDVGDYSDNFNGNLKAIFNVSGTLPLPVIEFAIISPEIDFHNELFSSCTMNGTFQNRKITVDSLKFLWHNNEIKSEGYYNLEGNAGYQVNSEEFKVNYNGLIIDGNLEINGMISEKHTAEMHLERISVNWHDIRIEDLELTAELRDNDFIGRLISLDKDLEITATGNFKQESWETLIRLRRLNLNNYLATDNLPLISGNINLTRTSHDLIASTALTVYDQDFGKLNGRIIADLFTDYQQQKSEFKLYSKNLKFNYETLEFDLEGEGSLDSLRTTRFAINKEIFSDAWVKFRPQIEFGFDLLGNNIEITRYLEYFFEDSFTDQFEGNVDFDISFISENEGNAKGNIQLQSVRYRDLDSLNVELEFEGTLDHIETNNFNFFYHDYKIAELSSQISLTPALDIFLDGEITELDLQKLFIEIDLQGKLNSAFSYFHNPYSDRLELWAEINDAVLNGEPLNSLSISFVQSDSLLTLHHFNLSGPGKFNLNCSGEIGYNILNNNYIPESGVIELTGNGDLLRLLADQFEQIESASSKTEFNMIIGTGDNGLSMRTGQFSLSRGEMKLTDQLIPMENIETDFIVENDSLHIDTCKFMLGTGHIYLDNVITGTDKDFFLGMINLGQFLVHTGENAVLFHLDKYMPANTVANTVITGRNTDYLTISGPFDEIEILGDIHFSNGYGIFPSETENLLKVFSKISGDESENVSGLPLKLDLMLYFDQNVYYVTYPLNLLVNEGSYLHLIYSEDNFWVKDAYFISEQGTIDIFGTLLNADYVQVTHSQFDLNPRIKATFYKIASDGTLITLEVMNLAEIKSSSSFKLDFKLTSDNPTDSRMDILALLRYGRRVDEISGPQKKTMLQDEVLQIAGFGIESAFMEPLISPLENWIRQALKLDFFHLQTNLIQNIFNRYSSDETDYIVDEEGSRQTQLTSDIFLDNLSIGMGKYLSRKLFLDYKVQFEKPQNLALSSEIGVYHNISLRYDLPLRLKLVYKFSVLPFDESDAHELSLERSFRF
ncbi:MAG: hypothetical protein JW996_06555, partial [Candidatus Cloacimonetes bacterium]|nr:hypothetical protein [Candidatus Cloacimonadota bacterium]